MADAHTKPQHDYHLVDPSPWPAVGSISAFIMAVGAIGWMHHMYAAAPFVFGVGVIGVLAEEPGAAHDLGPHQHRRDHEGEAVLGGRAHGDRIGRSGSGAREVAGREAVLHRTAPARDAAGRTGPA